MAVRRSDKPQDYTWLGHWLHHTVLMCLSPELPGGVLHNGTSRSWGLARAPGGAAELAWLHSTEISTIPHDLRIAVAGVKLPALSYGAPPRGAQLAQRFVAQVENLGIACKLRAMEPGGPYASAGPGSMFLLPCSGSLPALAPGYQCGPHTPAKLPLRSCPLLLPLTYLWGQGQGCPVGEGGSAVCAAPAGMSGAQPQASIVGAAWDQARFSELVGTCLQTRRNCELVGTRPLATFCPPLP